MNDSMVDRQREILRKCDLGGEQPPLEPGRPFWTLVAEKLLERIEALERRNEEMASNPAKMTVVEVYQPTARPLSEWSDLMGDVLWWKFPIEEAPYCGTPNDLGHVVEIWTNDRGGGNRVAGRVNIGGWPGYHTHWTPLPPVPKEPTP